MSHVPSSDELNSSDILDFWEERAKRFSDADLVNASNLEENIQLASEKHQQELAILDDYVRPLPGQVILDLGAGHCAWSVHYAKTVSHVDAVEYSVGMIELAQRNIRERGVDNVQLYQMAAQDFTSDRVYDTVLMSGLTIYLSNDQLQDLLERARSYVKPGGRIILRDGSGKKAPFLINKRYSDELDAYYSAYYRTAEQYIDVFANYGFFIESHQDMFPEGSNLNKRLETILRIYAFRNQGDETAS